jgi:hypothetical protein
MRHARWLQWGMVLMGALFTLSGCQGYTPPARWAYDEVDWRTVHVVTSASTTLSAFHDGMQRCGQGGYRIAGRYGQMVARRVISISGRSLGGAGGAY